MSESIRSNVELLEQGIALVENIGDALYAEPGSAGLAPVGAHFRHVLDHYDRLLNGYGEGQVDYDARRRDRDSERQTRIGVRRARSVIDRLRTLPAELLDRPVTVATRTHVDRSPECTESTLRRELQFLVSHTVHHYALIRAALFNRHAGMPEHFGVAASTIRHRDACAR